MAKSLLLNRINGKNYSVNLPCSATLANTFAQSFIDGEYAIYNLNSSVGSDVETEAWDIQVMIKNTTTKVKSYISLLMKSNKTEEDLFAVLRGLTINGILVDECYITSMKKVSF